MSYGKLFLSAVVKTNNRVLLNRVKEDLFYDKPISGDRISEREILNYIKGHVLAYRTLPTKAVLETNGIPYIDTDQPPEYYIDEMKKRAVFNAFKQFNQQISPVLGSNFNLDNAYDIINQFSAVVSHINSSDRSKTMTDLGHEMEAQIESRKNGAREIFVPFGWQTLDVITGGASGGDLVYFIGRPGKGKSSILAYNAHHAWKQGFSPMLLTMEMTDVQIARRIYGIEGQFNPDAVRRGIPDAEVERRLGGAINRFNDGPPFHVICGQTRQTVDSIAALIDELRPDVVYIDAAYLLKMNGPSKLLWEKIAAIGEQLKQVAITRDIPIIQTVQFNREAAKGNKFQLETIAGSDAIGQLGSIIVGIREASEYPETRRTLEILKNREGTVGEFNINYRFDPPDFTELNPLAGTNVETEEEMEI